MDWNIETMFDICHDFIKKRIKITSTLLVVFLKGGLGLGLGGFAEELAAAVNAARCF